MEGLNRWFADRISRKEAQALQEADARGIGELGTRGVNDARDAFRHAFLSASRLRDTQIMGASPVGELAVAVGGRYLEHEQLRQYCPIPPDALRASEMDLANNALGAAYVYRPFGESPGDYAQRLLEQGVLITSPDDAPVDAPLRAFAEAHNARCAGR